MDRLTYYINFARLLVARDRKLEQERRMTTPAAISKLTQHATRAKGLMADTERTADVAGPILDNYESTLTRFKANLSRVKDEEKQLAAVLQGMGNATEVIAGAFQDAEPAAAKAPVNGEQQQPQINGADVPANHPMPPTSPN